MSSPRTFHSRRNVRGFTLVELMVSTAVLVLLMGVLIAITNQTRLTWEQTTGKIEQFRDGRLAFEAITRKLSQATLNTYWDYERTAAGEPQRYVRQSELRFISGQASELVGGGGPRPSHAVFFQAPLGEVTVSTGAAVDYRASENLLNTCGYFIEFGPDADRPAFLTTKLVPQRYRYRFKELIEPSQNLTLYKYTSGEESPGKSRNASYVGLEWFRAPLTSSAPPVRTLAENIIALVLLPQLTAQDEPTGLKLAPMFKYDSTKTSSDPQINPRHQLPPVMQVTVLALAEQSAARIDLGGTAPPVWLQQLLEKSFVKAADLPRDRQAIEDALAARRLNYRVFSTNVSLKGAKWSTEQKN